MGKTTHFKAALFGLQVLRFYNQWQDEHGELSTEEIISVLDSWKKTELRLAEKRQQDSQKVVE